MAADGHAGDRASGPAAPHGGHPGTQPEDHGATPADERPDERPGAHDPYPIVTAQLALAGLAGPVVNTSVTVAVAAVAADFGAAIPLVAVTVLFLNVALAFVMPMAGPATRALGARRLLVWTGALVLASSVLLSLSPGLGLFGIARLAQGVGLAALLPASVQVSTQLLSGERRGRAFGWWAAGNGLGLALAPLVGGVLIDLVGWRWVTLPSCLLGVALVVTARLGIPAELRHDPGIRTSAVLWLSLVTGSLVSALAAASLGAWPVAGAAVVAMVASFLAARRSAGRGSDLAAFVGWLRELGVRRTALGSGLQMVAVGMVQVTVPAWLIVDGILTSAPAAALLTAMTLTMAAMGPATGRVRNVAYERWLRWGLVGCATGLAGLALSAGSGSWWLSLPSLVVLGIGAGALLSPSLRTFSHTVAGSNAVGLAMYNVLRLSAFAVGGVIGGVSVGAGAPWVAFAIAAAACAAAALLPRAQPTEDTMVQPAIEPVDGGLGG